MFQVKARTTNTRPVDDQSPEVSTTPTPGNFKINAVGALAIGVKNEDYLDVVVGEEEGVEAIYIAKGKAPVREEDGTEEKTDKDGNVKVVTKYKTVENAIGAKLASANGQMSGTLQASSANTFNALKGNKEANMIYSIDTENPQTDSATGTVYYKLTFVRQEAKQVKASKEA